MQVNERDQLDNASTQNFLSSPIASPKTKPQKPDEISVQLSFSFACSNTFKLLIAFGLLLLVGWNLYIYTTERAETVQPAVSPTAQPNNPPTRN
jgi:hypothetical protein